MAKIKFLLILAAKVIDLINSIDYYYKVNRDKGEILEDPLGIRSLGGDYYLPAKVDKVLDSVGYNNYSFCWLKGVRVAFPLKEGLLKSFSGYYKRLEPDLMAIAVVVDYFPLGRL